MFQDILEEQQSPQGVVHKQLYRGSPTNMIFTYTFFTCTIASGEIVLLDYVPRNPEKSALPPGTISLDCTVHTTKKYWLS